MNHLYKRTLLLNVYSVLHIFKRSYLWLGTTFKLTSLVFCFLLLFPLLSYAQATFTSVANGNWRDPATWSLEPDATAVPGVDDDVNIATGTTVTVNYEVGSSAKCSSVTLSVGDNGVSGSELIIEGVLQVSHFGFVFGQGASANKQPIIRIAQTGHLKVSNAFDLRVDGNGQAFFLYDFAPGSTIEYNGDGDQSIVSFFPYKNLILSGSGKKITDGPLGVAENFTIDGTANFDESASSYIHTIGGNWTNNATFTPGNTTVLLTGNLASISQVEIGGSTATVFHNLTIDLPDDGSKSALVTNNISVNSNMSFSDGILHTGLGNDLSTYNLITLEPTANLLTPEADDLYIKGRLATQRTVSSSGASFGGIGFNVTDSSMDPGEIRVERVTGFPRLGEDNNQSVPRYFEVSPISGDYTDLDLKMDFSFLNYELGNTSISNYELVREVINGDFDKVSSKNISSSSRPHTVQNTDKGIFGRYTLSNKNAPLPVDLVWFKAEPKGSDVLLTWQTAWELENAGFEVQLSEDGKVFRKVGFVQTGSPTKTGAQTYSFLHNDFRGTGTRYYRLAQHDLDGTVNYSMLRSVEVRNEGTFSVYPNPFINELTVVLPTDEPCEVVLTNHLGKQVYSAAAGSSQHSIKLDTPLQNGVYFLSIQTGNNTYTRKLIKR